LRHELFRWYASAADDENVGGFGIKAEHPWIFAVLEDVAR
jgi:hypothetical protein